MHATYPPISFTLISKSFGCFERTYRLFACCVVYTDFFLGVPLDANLEATYAFETSVDFQQITQCYISGDRSLHKILCENLKSYILVLVEESI
jgi:hypothetical protein